MKMAMCTLLDDNFYIGFVGFWKSFIKHNEWFKDSVIDFVVIDNGLSDHIKKKMQSYCPKIIFRPVDKKNYTRTNFSLTADRLKATYYTLDVFGMVEYDRIVFLDMDIVVLDDVSLLWKITSQIAGCQVYNSGMDVLGQGINSGVFVINRPAISIDTYKELLKLSAKALSMPDQKIINSHFSGEIEYIAKNYNVEKRMLHTKNLIDIKNHPKIIHFVASKPWERDKPNEIEASFGEWENIWHSYYNS